jgi:hypothetical protein
MTFAGKELNQTGWRYLFDNENEGDYRMYSVRRQGPEQIGEDGYRVWDSPGYYRLCLSRCGTKVIRESGIEPCDAEDLKMALALHDEDIETMKAWEEYRKELSDGDRTLLEIFRQAQAHSGDGTIPMSELLTWDHPAGHKTQGRFWQVGANASCGFKLGLDEYNQPWKASFDYDEPDDLSFTQLKCVGNPGYLGNR